MLLFNANHRRRMFLAPLQSLSQVNQQAGHRKLLAPPSLEWTAPQDPQVLLVNDSSTTTMCVSGYFSATFSRRPRSWPASMRGLRTRPGHVPADRCAPCRPIPISTRIRRLTLSQMCSSRGRSRQSCCAAWLSRRSSIGRGTQNHKCPSQVNCNDEYILFRRAGSDSPVIGMGRGQKIVGKKTQE